VGIHHRPGSVFSVERGTLRPAADSELIVSFPAQIICRSIRKDGCPVNSKLARFRQKEDERRGQCSH
jgi:hypothetical protein